MRTHIYSRRIRGHIYSRHIWGHTYLVVYEDTYSRRIWGHTHRSMRKRTSILLVILSKIPNLQILPYVCPHTSIYVFSYLYICVLILLHVCPHTTTCMSSGCSADELWKIKEKRQKDKKNRQPTTVCVSSYYFYMCVLKLRLHLCPHTTSTCVSSYHFYMCVLIQLL